MCSFTTNANALFHDKSATFVYTAYCHFFLEFQFGTAINKQTFFMYRDRNDEIVVNQYIQFYTVWNVYD